MDISDVDLNLLVVLDALLRTRSVSRAAQQLRISQPAASLALNRLRETFGDPLFVRTGKVIHPTPFAEAMTAPLEAIIGHIRSDLLQERTFDSATAQRTVTLNMQDIGELVFLPQIFERLSVAAPGLQLRTVDLPAAELERALRTGEVDLAIGQFPELVGAALYQQRLLTYTFVCIVRADHPTIGHELTRMQFREGRHAIVHPAGQLNDALDAELQQLGLNRRVSARIEHFLAIPNMLERSDLIFTVPHAIGASLARLAAIKLVKPPFKTRPCVVRQHWHARFRHDAANRWLRGVVADLFLKKTPRARKSGR